MSDRGGMDVDARILAAAAELVHAHGPRFTLAQLGDATQLSRATLYRAIGSKQALLARLPRDPGVATEPPTDARSRMLQAARTVFGRHGLAGATMEQVAAAAGVGVVTVYRHFGTKDGLVQAFVEEVAPRSTVHDVATRPSADVRADLLGILEAVLPFIHDNRDVFRLILGGNAAERAYLERLRPLPGRTLRQLAAYFEHQVGAGRLRPAGPAQDLALAFVGMVLSFALIGPALYGIALADTARASRLIADVFLAGLEA